MDGTEFTIFFEDPFWVGILVSDRDGLRFVARTVFGAEPTNAELLRFMADRFARLVAEARPIQRSARTDLGPKKPVSAKRGARASGREQKRGPGKAIAAAHAAFELARAESRASRTVDRAELAERRFELRSEKKKAAKRGK